MDNAREKGDDLAIWNHHHIQSAGAECNRQNRAATGEATDVFTWHGLRELRIKNEE